MKRKMIQIGIGGWGWSWQQVVVDSAVWELAAIVDLNAELLDKAAAQFGLDREKQCFSSLGEALAVVHADAALVIVPPQFHASVAIEAMERGLDCIVEKPLAHTIQDARRIVEAADRLGRKLMVGQNYRFKRAPQTVKSLLGRDLIGEIGSVYIQFQKDPAFTGFRTEMEEPLITDMAIHHFDQIRGILGLEPVKITAVSWNPRWSRFAGNAAATVLFEMSNGARVSYTGSWVSRGWETTWDGDWRIQGDGGEIHWADNEVTVKPHDLFKTVFQEGAVEKRGALQADLLRLPAEERQATLLEFSLAIDDNRAPETSGADNIKSMAMVIGAVRSAELGRPVTIEEIMNG